MSLQTSTPGGSAVIIVEESTGIAYWAGDIKSQGTTRPSTPTEGWIHCNTSSNPAVLEFYDGGAWRPWVVSLTDLSNVSGSPNNISILYYEEGSTLWKPYTGGLGTSVIWVNDSTSGNQFFAISSSSVLCTDENGAWTEVSPGGKGGLMVGDVNGVPIPHGVGTNGDILRADSTQTTGLVWDDVATVLADGNIDDIGDVSASSPGTGDRLVWTGSTWANEDMEGTAFPGSPREGQRFYRTDLEEWFFYDSSRSKWLGLSMIQYDGFDGSTVSATTYTLMRGAIRYSATVGFVVPFDCIVVGMTVLAAASSTGTVFVRDDGSNVTGASIALASATTAVDYTLNSSTIAGGSILGFTVTSGSFIGIVVTAQIRRVAT